ncbi:MAG: hypothetical protein WCD44_01035 [Candidatus Babeliales bacterium]
MKIDEKTGLYNNYDIWHKPFWQTTTFYWAMIAVATLIFIVICYFLIKKYFSYKKKKILPTWQRLLQELESQWTIGLIKPEQSKKFYHLVTAILKNYLQDQFNFSLHSKTDDEVIAYLAQKEEITQKVLENIQTVFKGSILIKFANEQAIQEQIEHDYKRTITLINEMQKEREGN